MYSSETSFEILSYQHVLYSTPPNIQGLLLITQKVSVTIPSQSTFTSLMQQPILLNYCECCGRMIGSSPQLKFNYDPIQAAYLGPGIPLYFAFFRCTIFLLLIYLFGYSLITTISNINGTYCQSECGNLTIWNQISVFNTFNDIKTMKTQVYLELAVILTTIFVNFLIRSYLNYLEIYIDQVFAKPSDYSVMIRKIPAEATKQDIEEMVEKHKRHLSDEQLQQSEHLKIVEILMLQNLSQYIEYENKNVKDIKKQIKEKQKNQSLQIIYKVNPIIPNVFARTAILIFSNSRSKSFFLDNTYTPSSLMERVLRTFWGSYYPRSSIHKILNQFVSIKRAPEPDDLIWENCGKDSMSLFRRRVALYFLSFLVLCGGGVTLAGIQWLRNNYVSPQNTFVQFSFSLGASIIITIFNFLIEQILQFMACREGHDTKTQLKVAVTFRIVFFQFLNSGVFMVLSSIFVKLVTNDKHTYDFRKSILAFNIIQVMTFNALLGNFNNFIINKFEIVKQYPRRLILHSLKLYPQIQSNIAFEPPTLFIHAKYSYLFKTFWVTVFFMPTIPIVASISFIGLFVNYWIQKYLVSGVYKAPQSISSYLSNHVLNLLDYTPLWLTFGSIFVHFVRSQFEYDNIPSDIKTFHYLFLVLSVVNIFLPYHAILKRLKLFKQAKPNENSYEESLLTFQLTYEDTNPINQNSKRKVRDEQIFRKQITKETSFKQMRMRLSQTQILTSHKQSLLFKSSGVTGTEIFGRPRTGSL